MSNTQRGEDHAKWKGDGVKYRALHEWIERWKGKPKECSVCGEIKNRVGWANIDHRYRRVLDDYIRMCPNCHAQYDREKRIRKNFIYK